MGKADPIALIASCCKFSSFTSSARDFLVSRIDILYSYFWAGFRSPLLMVQHGIISRSCIGFPFRGEFAVVLFDAPLIFFSAAFSLKLKLHLSPHLSAFFLRAETLSFGILLFTFMDAAKTSHLCLFPLFCYSGGRLWISVSS